MNNILFLHTVDDAEHCVREKLHERFILFSTHSSVDVYLQQKYNITCRCLSTLFTTAQVLRLRQEASDIVEVVLDILDRRISPVLNKQTGLDIQWFRPLYSYYSKYYYYAYLLFQLAVETVIRDFQPDEIGLYPYTFSTLVCSNRTLEEVVHALIPSAKVITFAAPKQTMQSRSNLYKLIQRLTSPRKVFSYVQALLRKRLQHQYSVSAGKALLLMTEPTGEISFLLGEKTEKYDVLYYVAGSDVPAGYTGKQKNSELQVDFREAEDEVRQKIGTTVAELFVEDIQRDFTSALSRYVCALHILQDIHIQQPIGAGLWGGPPVECTFALLYEYLRSVGVPVIGYQHGSVYGDSWEPWHFNSDFSRCDYFISYGWTKDDLHRLYPDQQTEAEIMPFGKVKLSSTVGAKRNIDILFPLTSSISIFEGGMIRIPPHELTERQIRLLEYLNSLENCSVYVKLFPYSTAANCSVLPVLHRLKNLHVVDDVGFSGFLETHQPQAVLIEFPSTPLLEVLHLDTEVFVMNDSLHPFETQALEELRKRVYYTEDTGEMIGLLQRFVGGALERKRDDTFLRHYVVREHSKENIRRLVESAIAGERPTRRK